MTHKTKRILRIFLGLVLTSILLGANGCDLTPPGVTLEVVDSLQLINQGVTLSLKAVGTTSKAGTLTYSFDSSCGGSFKHTKINADKDGMVDTLFDSSKAHEGRCTLSVRLSTKTLEKYDGETTITVLPSNSSLTLFWSDRSGNIHRASSASPTIDSISDIRTSGALAIDLQSRQLYWTSESSILRSNLDVFEETEVVSQLPNEPRDIVLDTDNKKLYWISRNKIQRVGLDGQSKEVLRIKEGDLPVTELEDPGSLALDSSNQTLYWTEHGNVPKSDRIQSLDLNAFDQSDQPVEPRTVVDKRADLGGIAIDPDREVLYWTEGSDINKSDLDGSSKFSVVHEPAQPQRLVIDLIAKKLYWTNSDDSIQRSNLDGSDVEDVVTGLSEAPLSIAIVP